MHIRMIEFQRQLEEVKANRRAREAASRGITPAMNGTAGHGENGEYNNRNNNQINGAGDLSVAGRLCT